MIAKRREMVEGSSNKGQEEEKRRQGTMERGKETGREEGVDV